MPATSQTLRTVTTNASAQNAALIAANDPAYRAILDEAHKRMQLARVHFQVRAPYWAPMLAKLILLWRAGFGTFGVTARGHLLVDPKVLLDWANKEGVECIAGVLAHEALHVMLKHAIRCGDRAPKRWNVAADLYINGLLVEAGFQLPSCGVFPETDEHTQGQAVFATPTPWHTYDANGNRTGNTVVMPAGKTADWYYDNLPVPPAGQGQGDGESDGESDGEGQGGACDAPGTESPERADGNEGGPCDGSCGTGAGGEEQDGEPAAGEVDEDGDTVPERSKGEIDSTIDECARKTAEAAAKQAANVPGAMAVWANMQLAPARVRWQDKLRRRGKVATAEAGRGRQSYRRMNRRQVCMGAHPRNPILPVFDKTLCVVWYVIDTSGSMSRQDHADALSELLGVVGAGAEVHVLSCDTQVYGDPVKLPRSKSAAGRLIKNMLEGGGGTDFRPAFRKAEAAKGRKAPNLLVFATDGYGPAPATSKIPTIWLITPGGTEPATFGDVIKIDDLAA